VTLNEALGGEDEAQSMSLVRPAMVKDPLKISELIGGKGGEAGGGGGGGGGRESGMKSDERGDLDRREYSQLSLVYEVAGEGTVSGYEPLSHSRSELANRSHSATFITFNQSATFSQASNLDTPDGTHPRANHKQPAGNQLDWISPESNQIKSNQIISNQIKSH
jgi:hypothetical protein